MDHGHGARATTRAPRVPTWPVVAAVLPILTCARPGEDREPAGCPAPLDEAVELAEIERHLVALDEIAAAHGGNRSAASAGDAASRTYVLEALRALGYSPWVQSFAFDDYELLGPSTLRQVAPTALELVEGVDFRPAKFSGSGAVVGSLTPIDLALGTGNTTTSGCEPEDYLDFAAGGIALVQRGGCTYARKVDLAIAAGAAAMVLFNQGDTDARLGLFTPRLPVDNSLPVVATTHAVGVDLAGANEVEIVVDGRVVVRTTENVIVDTPATESGQVVMLGAHLDSVAAGPGINDNGSGSAAILAVAGEVTACELRHQVRFAFWGAEEHGLLGSIHYVSTLDEAALADIGLYLNFDMIASPNPAYFVYDGDGSAFDLAGPEGSAEIEAALSRSLTDRGVVALPTAFDGRSDYWAFIDRGIPAGGLFTGAEAAKTVDEAAYFGGVAGAPYDPCYHQACDTLENLNFDALLENARAIAEVTETFAMAPVADQSELGEVDIP